MVVGIQSADVTPRKDMVVERVEGCQRPCRKLSKGGSEMGNLAGGVFAKLFGAEHFHAQTALAVDGQKQVERDAGLGFLRCILRQVMAAFIAEKAHCVVELLIPRTIQRDGERTATLEGGKAGVVRV